MHKKIKNKISLSLIVAIFVACFVFVLGHNIAKSANVADETQTQEDVDDLEKKAESYRRMIDLKQQQQNTLKNQLETMEINESIIENNVHITKKEIEEKEETIENLQEDISGMQEEIDKSKEGLGEMLRTYYKIEEEITLSMLSSQGSLSEIFDHSEYLNQASQDLEKALKEIKNKKDELTKNRTELENKKNELEGTEDKLKDELTNLANEKQNKSVLLNKTAGEEAKYQKLLSDIEDEIYNLESGKSVDYGSVPAARGGYFDYPVASVRITQGYGMTSFAKSGAYGGKAHNGVDFGVSYQSVFAVRDGKVIGSGNNGGYAYGQWIALDHGDGLVTLYGHLSKKSVSVGDKVDKGDKIAVSGNTGFSTGPHLHFSVFDKKSFELSSSKYVSGLKIPTGASINPTKYF